MSTEPTPPQPEQQSVFLRHVLDESHAGCINGCLHCGEINELAAQEAREFKADQHYAGYNSAIEGEPQQSAVEWLKRHAGSNWPHPDYAERIMFEGCDCYAIALEDYGNLYDDALELAQRCDAAESQRDALEWLENEAPQISHDSWTCSVDMAGNRWTMRFRNDGKHERIRGRTLLDTISQARAARAKKEGQ